MALKAVCGSLISPDLLDAVADGREPVGRLRSILADARRTVGPASAPRQIFDAHLPLLREIGLDATIVRTAADALLATFNRPGGPAIGLLSAGGWGADFRRLRHAAAAHPSAARWWIGVNGLTLRVMDATRAYTKRGLDFDLEGMEDDEGAARVLRRILSSEGDRLPALAALLENTARHRVAVGRSLQVGVQDALVNLVEGFSRGRRTGRTTAAFGDALTVVYRILFLLFAEARGLVPQWHPVYRESYTIESLRPAVEAGGSPAGLWQSLQAIARLAHRGCTAGTLRVVPFNGRLFAPASAPLADSFRLDDRVARQVLLAVTTRPGADRRERIAYGDLGVEQLGAVYERVLDYLPGSGGRKPSGTFYTPRAMTEFLVRRTLAPLVRGRSAEGILTLRIVDPAMGSGAFLVAACRYLADAYEEALLAGGMASRGDFTAADRAGFRRIVAQRCLYGVDVNPVAVQLARLSLWLCTLAADRPLTFLDHHLRCGNSLVGARAIDIARQPPGRGRGTAAPLPLFAAVDLAGEVGPVVGTRIALERVPDDTAAIVRGKERAHDDLSAAGGPLGGWRACADAWCAGWFWPDRATPIGARAWPAFSAALRGSPAELPAALEAEWRATVAEVAAERRFFHWELEFPEAFFDAAGTPLDAAGFDAVIGNPPWADAAAVAGFTRASGCYGLQGRGHANLYQAFAERMLQLAAPAGRVGIVVPAGFLGDHGCAALRRHLFDRCTVDTIVGFDNRDALFPIHRGLRFSLIVATTTGSTTELPVRYGLRSAAPLEDVPDEGRVPGTLQVPIGLVRRFSGDGLAVPELAAERDRAILARALDAAPPVGEPEGWHARFGRELNATEDRGHFGARGLPVIDGKHIEPYRVHAARAVRFIAHDSAKRLLGSRSAFDRPRLGYREVASSTNRLTLIAAVIPAGVVTTHTIFCLRTPDDEDLQWYLCGIFNSFMANYLVRLRGGTHLPAAAIHRLPVPRPGRESIAFRRMAALARVADHDVEARAEIHARSAAAYGLDRGDFAHVLRSFPLVPAAEREAALRRFGI